MQTQAQSGSAPVIELDPAKIMGGLPDGSAKVAAGSKTVGMKPQLAA